MEEKPNQNLYRIAAIGALIVILFGLMDIIVTFLPGGMTPDPGKGEALFYIQLLSTNWFLGLRSLGFWNCITLLLGIPLFLSLHKLNGDDNKAISMLALLFLVIGTAIYCTNNPALPMLQIARQYAMAIQDTQKALLLNAGQFILLRGEDFTPGFFMGFFLQHIAGFMMSILMLRSQIFKKGWGILGIIGFTLMSIFLVWSTFIPAGYMIAMMISMVGGLFLMGWYLLIAIRLLRLSSR